jgi:transcriptional regulator with XRE-family HTH domain
MDKSSVSFFQSNMNYISTCFSKLKNKTISSGDLSALLNVSRMTVHGWLSGKHTPSKTTGEKVAKVLNKIFSWRVSVNELFNEDISLSYNIDSLLEADKERSRIAFLENIDDSSRAVGERLKNLRKNKGWSLIDVSQKSKELFPKQDTYWISHSYIADIERGKIVDFHVNKIKSLATIYGERIEYILTGKEIPNKMTVDKLNNLLIIPLNINLINRSEHEIDAFIEKLEKIIDALDPDALKS